ncbi:flagellar basal body rod protein [Ligilactobacillus ruminis SPM0211]|uniref:Flagellar basal body rod protein n=1 Tax=Ligilactobacillus ruminis SPM0211 TaxID=1040964 RepID=F7R0N0_9LACO|nr:flagellar basal body rod protein [Ligilactobacillus ruminis SPM0211]
MSIFNGLQINASGLSLERMKLDVASTNIANVNTTRTAEGGPYKKKTVEFSENLRQAQGTNKIKSSPNLCVNYFFSRALVVQGMPLHPCLCTSTLEGAVKGAPLRTSKRFP